MNEKQKAQSARDRDEFFTNQPTVTNRYASIRKRCAQCGEPFGLIRRRRTGMQFCSLSCLNE